MVTDALGNEVIVGNWYGYSRNDGGFSHVTLGVVTSVKEETGKVRMCQCKVTRWLYGKPSNYRADDVPADVSIIGNMVFPVQTQQEEELPIDK